MDVLCDNRNTNRWGSCRLGICWAQPHTDEHGNRRHGEALTYQHSMPYGGRHGGEWLRVDREGILPRIVRPTL